MALTAVTIKKAQDGKLFDERGLFLEKRGNRGTWYFRYTFGDRRPEMSLGPYPALSLADARKERDKWDLVRKQGRDPLSEKQNQKAAAVAAMAYRDPTLEELAHEYFEVYKINLKKDGRTSRWMSPLATHVFPRLGKRRVSSITRQDIHDVLEPIWRTKHPTAKKAAERLTMIFSDGQIRDYKCDPLTVRQARLMLGKVPHKAKPQPSVDWRNIPALFKQLEGQGTSASCLQFMILTVVRSGGCRGARFDEIDGDVWTVPGERMKSEKGHEEDFHVPLSPAARKILERRGRLGNEWVFTGHKGQPLSDNAVSKFMRDNKLGGVPHGMRASFSTWCQDQGDIDPDIREAILAHKVGDKTVRAYARSDVLELRRAVLLKWSRFVTSTLYDD